MPVKVGDIVDLPECWGAKVIAVKHAGTIIRCEWYHVETGETLRYWYDTSYVTVRNQLPATSQE